VSARFPGDHQLVLLDTTVWIYHLEQHPEFGAAAGKIIAALRAGTILGVSSELTLLELTVKPLRLERQNVADEYELLLSNFPNLTLEPISRDILLRAASLRASHRLRTPDAIQLATGLEVGATLAITNDAGWRNIPGVETMMLSGTV
jgi:predicted nucleic acid-binding protein